MHERIYKRKHEKNRANINLIEDAPSAGTERRDWRERECQ